MEGEECPREVTEPSLDSCTDGLVSRHENHDFPEVGRNLGARNTTLRICIGGEKDLLHT